MTFRELFQRLDHMGLTTVGEARDTLLYRCQHCLQLINEHADDEKCLFGPTVFKGFPRRAVDSYVEFQCGEGTARNLLRRKAT